MKYKFDRKGTRELKKDIRGRFFCKASLSGLTNYVIRHSS